MNSSATWLPLTDSADSEVLYRKGAWTVSNYTWPSDPHYFGHRFSNGKVSWNARRSTESRAMEKSGHSPSLSGAGGKWTYVNQSDADLPLMPFTPVPGLRRSARWIPSTARRRPRSVQSRLISRAELNPFPPKAVGGATVNDELVQGYTGPGSTIPSPSVLDQIASFLKLPRGGSNDLSKSLVIIYGGANDAFFGLPNITAAEVVDSLRLAAKRLKARGASHFLLPTLPPLGTNYPFSTLVPGYSRPLAKFAAEHRAALLALAKSDSSIVIADLFPLFQSIYKNPASYGFDPTVLDRSCLRGGELSSSRATRRT